MSRISAVLLAICTVLATSTVLAPPTQAAGQTGPVAHYGFDSDGDADGLSTTAGLSGLAARFGSEHATTFRELPDAVGTLGSDGDFSIRFWVRTQAASDQRYVLVSQKSFADNSLASQKQPGWVFYSSGGTWAWNIGSGSRRLTYERDNGHRMPLNDGQWHQLAMTYSRDLSVVRLYYDGANWATYHVTDAEGFDFTSSQRLTVGAGDYRAERRGGVLPAIAAGATNLQAFVDAFNALGLRPVESDEFLRVIVDPRAFYEQTAGQAPDEGAWEPVAAAERRLMESPYTTHQALEFMAAAPLTKIYSFVDGKVTVRRDVAERFAEAERLSSPDFALDELAIWDRVLTPEEVRSGYEQHVDTTLPTESRNVSTLSAAAWNIWHGGKHFTPSEHGWDSRERVAEVIATEGVDVVMMQETYSSGDFIAAELGYYFATTVDWDYLNQGSNISVLSRYPIVEIHVQEDSPFHNVGTRLRLSETQDIYVMSNWYGMGQFPTVFDFHRSRFAESDTVPVLFGGDFNAIPHTDGGDSPASVALLEAGFTDAFRSLRPSLVDWPGPTHLSGRRIDQLYYKGAGLTNTSTRVISTWARGFPSDHFMILSHFDLDYLTRPPG